jgi:hypothetical protein
MERKGKRKEKREGKIEKKRDDEESRGNEWMTESMCSCTAWMILIVPY